jgi:hypothetical protein
MCGTADSAQQLKDPENKIFTFEGAGKLKANSGTGLVDNKNYVPGMRFPIEKAPAYLNSQVYGNGGSKGPAGTDYCDKVNFSYPWRDNFCESRPGSKQEAPACPKKIDIHQGQDIRAKTCLKNTWWAVAALAGKVSFDNPKGALSTLETVSPPNEAYKFRYLHMSDLPANRPKPFGAAVNRGDQVGKVSKIHRSSKCFKLNGVDQYRDECTSVHLHFEIFVAIRGANGQRTGWRRVSPYKALVDSYERLLKNTP